MGRHDRRTPDGDLVTGLARVSVGGGRHCAETMSATTAQFFTPALERFGPSLHSTEDATTDVLPALPPEPAWLLASGPPPAADDVPSHHGIRRDIDPTHPDDLARVLDALYRWNPRGIERDPPDDPS